MTHDETMQVEYYDQLTEQQRREYREGTVDISPAVREELDRIDRGLKALCLS